MHIFFLQEGDGGFVEEEMSILLYFFVAKSVFDPKSNDKYRHLIICHHGSVSVKLYPITEHFSPNTAAACCSSHLQGLGILGKYKKRGENGETPDK